MTYRFPLLGTPTANEEPVPEDVYASWSGSASPDGSLVAFVSDRGGSPGLWLQDPGRARPAPLPRGWGRVTSTSWSPDGGWLACVTDAPGASRSEVWVVRPNGTQPHRIAGSGGGTALLGVGPWHGWTEDGRLLVTETAGAEATAVLVDPAAEHREVLDTGGQRLLLDLRGGSALVRVGPRGRRHLEVVRGGRRVPVSGGEGPGLTDLGFLSSSGGTVYARTNAGREFFALVAVRPGTGERRILAARDDAELEDVVPAPDRSSVLLLWNESGGCSALSLLDLGSGVERHLGGLPREVVEDCRFRDGRSVLLTAQGWDDARGVWSLDLASGTAVPLSSPDDGSLRASRGATVPVVETSELTRPTLHRFPARDGLPLTGWLYRPDRPPPLPTLVYLHGGPEAQERPVYNSLFQALVGAGIAVLGLNFRGSSGLGRSFSEADDLDRRFAAVDDVADCVAYLQAAGVADAGRVGVMGRSYGGYLTLAALVQHPELFAAGVDVCGMSDFETFYAHTEPWIGAAAEAEYGHPERDADLLRTLSPIHRIDRIKAPLLVVHGDEDTNVPVIESEQLVSALLERGGEHRYLLFPGEGHELLATHHRVAFVQETVAWLSRHLGILDADRSATGKESPA